jgi:ribosomal protein L37AE/L43A
VPNDKFGISYGDTFVAAVNWILETERDKLLCVNEKFYLVRESAAECWPRANCAAFLDEVVKLWKNWK